jgi:hypothetical protein
MRASAGLVQRPLVSRAVVMTATPAVTASTPAHVTGRRLSESTIQATMAAITGLTERIAAVRDGPICC